ncbi:MAG: NAD-dependent DNA ligase LigA, partial [Bacteroidales bacterium]|nr:NAD-dependent DNA ligase LigA [Bacteroidales bacterium]
DQLYKMGLANTPSDLYRLKADQLTCLEGWKERAATRFLGSVKESRSVPFERVLFAIGIRFVGETTARDIARHFGSIEALEQASKEDLLAVPEVGEVIAESVYNFFRDADNIKEIEALKASGLNFSTEKAEAASDALQGKSIVISGNFSISRDDMKALIEANGGRNSSSVSSRTDYLLAGTKPGPEKLKKAAELGIPVIGEEEFMAMLPAKAASAPSAPDIPMVEENDLTLF